MSAAGGMHWQVVFAKDKLFLGAFMALKGKCSPDQADGQTSAHREHNFYTVV